MADLKPIEFPHHLNNHTLTQQELAALTEGQQAIAKDWNVINRKMDWVIDRLVEQHNIMVEHDRLLDTWKKWLWASTIVVGTGGSGATLLYLFLRYSVTGQ